MPIHRPKILTSFEVPTGGWAFDLYVDLDGANDSYDEKIDCTIAAGTYFVAFDNQSDDFVQAFMDAAYTGLQSATHANYNTTTRLGKPVLTLTNAGKTQITVSGGYHMRFDWTADDGASVAAVLGFDGSAADDYSSGNNLTSDYQHAYGWYSDEDGQLESLFTENHKEAIVNQSISLGSQIKTHHIATHETNLLSLGFLSRAQTWSGNIGYTTSPEDPYQPNVALECWWLEAIQGKRFRVYRDGYPSLDSTGIAINRQEYSGSGTDPAPSSTTWEDTSKAFATSPQELKGKILAHLYTAEGSNNVLVRRYISSHTATVLTLPNDIHNQANVTNDGTYWILDQTYETYVLDTDRMGEFAPRELPNIDQYSVRVPLRKYVA